MNYRFHHAGSQEVDVMFVPQRCLQTTVSDGREAEDLIMVMVGLHL